MFSIRLSQWNHSDPIMVATGIKTTKEAGEMIDHFLHEGFSAMGIEPSDIMSMSVVKEVTDLPLNGKREEESLSSSAPTTCELCGQPKYTSECMCEVLDDHLF